MPVHDVGSFRHPRSAEYGLCQHASGGSPKTSDRSLCEDLSCAFWEKPGASGGRTILEVVLLLVIVVILAA